MAKKLTRASKIRKYLDDNPTAKTADVAKVFETRYQNVYAIRRKMETPKVSKEAQWRTLGVFSSNTPMQGVTHNVPVQIEMFEPKADPVNHPAHYKTGGIETIDFIEAKQLDYNLGNVIKYVTRADHKGNKLEDLRKAQWYLTRAIETAK
jgi:hypothetical protein